ncbi:MAG: hypothetical protein L6R45_29680 [Anaerolineae bacterium]|nr:hypothetical protein [Anaerolineae bacterium]
MKDENFSPAPLHPRTPAVLTTPDSQALFKQWEAWGLQPMEVAAEELEQRITIKHNALTQQVEWKTEKLDGIQALGLLAQTIYSMFGYFVKGQARPRFTSGQAKVAVCLDGNRLTVGIDPLHDPLVVKGALLAALWEVMERSTQAQDGAEGGDPLKAWESLFETTLNA